MLRKGLFRLTVVWLALAVVTAEESCPLKQNNCECSFSPDADDGGESVAADSSTKTEAMAAAAGAMSPLLIGGAGLGIWKLVKSRGGDDSMSLDRSDSNISDNSSPRSLPPKYSSRQGSINGDDDEHGSFANTRGSRTNKPPVAENINSWM